VLVDETVTLRITEFSLHEPAVAVAERWFRIQNTLNLRCASGVDILMGRSCCQEASVAVGRSQGNGGGVVWPGDVEDKLPCCWGSRGATATSKISPKCHRFHRKPPLNFWFLLPEMTNDRNKTNQTSHEHELRQNRAISRASFRNTFWPESLGEYGRPEVIRRAAIAVLILSASANKEVMVPPT